MGARNGDAVLEPHQLRKHLGARDDGDATLARHVDLDIVAGHRRGVDDDVGALHVGRLVAGEDLGSQALEPLHRLPALLVGAGDAIAQVQQHLGDPAHPDAADTHEVKLLILLEHA